MKRFRVSYNTRGEGYVDIEATTEEEASEQFESYMCGDTYEEWITGTDITSINEVKE